MTQSNPTPDAKIAVVKQRFTEIQLNVLKLYAEDDLYHERMLALYDVVEGLEQNIAEPALNQKIDIFYQKMAEISKEKLAEFHAKTNNDYDKINNNLTQYAYIEQEFTAIKKQRLAGVLLGGLIIAGIAGAVALVVAFPGLLFNPLTLGIFFCICVDKSSNYPRHRDDHYRQKVTLESIFDNIFCLSDEKDLVQEQNELSVLKVGMFASNRMHFELGLKKRALLDNNEEVDPQSTVGKAVTQGREARHLVTELKERVPENKPVDLNCGAPTIQ